MNRKPIPSIFALRARPKRRPLLSLVRDLHNPNPNPQTLHPLHMPRTATHNPRMRTARPSAEGSPERGAGGGLVRWRGDRGGEVYEGGLVG